MEFDWEEYTNLYNALITRRLKKFCEDVLYGPLELKVATIDLYGKEVPIIPTADNEKPFLVCSYTFLKELAEAMKNANEGDKLRPRTLSEL